MLFRCTKTCCWTECMRDSAGNGIRNCVACLLFISGMSFMLRSSVDACARQWSQLTQFHCVASRSEKYHVVLSQQNSSNKIYDRLNWNDSTQHGTMMLSRCLSNTTRDSRRRLHETGLRNRFAYASVLMPKQKMHTNAVFSVVVSFISVWFTTPFARIPKEQCSRQWMNWKKKKTVREMSFSFFSRGRLSHCCKMWNKNAHLWLISSKIEEQPALSTSNWRSSKASFSTLTHPIWWDYFWLTTAKQKWAWKTFKTKAAMHFLY